MEFGSLDDGGNFEHNRDSFVETSRRFAIQGALVFGMRSFDNVY